MVRRASVILFVAALSGPAFGAPTSLRMTSVKVVKQGQFAASAAVPGGQTAADCSRFRVSSAAARKWFARAREVSKHVWLEELDWTECFVEGVLTTATKKTYRWELDQSGRARIITSKLGSIYMSGADFFENDSHK